MTTQSSNTTQIQRLMDKIDEIGGAINRLDSRLDVHDQKHVQLEKEQQDHAELLKCHGEKLQTVDSRSEQTKKDLDRLTGTIDKLVWVFVTPLAALVVGAIIWAVAQGVK